MLDVQVMMLDSIVQNFRCNNRRTVESVIILTVPSPSARTAGGFYFYDLLN
jgi:hypothetical protein